MKRLSFFSSAAAATLAPLALQGSADADSALTAPITQDEWKPFEEIAKAKGSKIEFNNVQKQGAMGEIHLDMNMVNASIANAAARAKAAGNMHLAAKFDRLAANGTAAISSLGRATTISRKTSRKAFPRTATRSARVRSCAMPSVSAGARRKRRFSSAATSVAESVASVR